MRDCLDAKHRHDCVYFLIEYRIFYRSMLQCTKLRVSHLILAHKLQLKSSGPQRIIQSVALSSQCVKFKFIFSAKITRTYGITQARRNKSIIGQFRVNGRSPDLARKGQKRTFTNVRY